MCVSQAATVMPLFSRSRSDALREVHKYSGPEPMQDAKVNPNVYDHVHMKLFRAQRNLYISGFSLFLWLIMRRVVTLLNQAAVTLESSAGLQAQMESAVKAAKQNQEDNLRLKQALLDEENSLSAKNQQLKQEVEKLAGQLKTAKEAVNKSDAEVEAMKRQAKGLAHEYDRLLTEHHQLQNLQSSEDKKDQ
ncbi:B-cell receptor-associated protein 29-like [Solea senegalensis]|uniref:Endoplasmic reticulum transmembrane protein n=1 Tax=Solea senegalensis TaxID=28829 RepID=A0AAV6SZV4_SOLSE|nr:B-cell receptor-associated protein 29-like [Solea senegalensis]